MLLPVFDHVDLLEQNPIFLSKAREYLNNSAKVDNYFCYGMQDFRFKDESKNKIENSSTSNNNNNTKTNANTDTNTTDTTRLYDLIWIQWVTGHLTDIDFITFFQRCQQHLKKNGMIVLKENTTANGFIVDKTDSSLTRYVMFYE